MPAAPIDRRHFLQRTALLGTALPLAGLVGPALAQKAEQVDVIRVQALSRLVQRRGKPAPDVMQEIGWKSGEGGA